MVVANHALVMAAMESEAVLPEPKNLLLVLDEGHHLPDVARDALEMSAEITAPGFACSWICSASWWPPAWSSFARNHAAAGQSGAAHRSLRRAFRADCLVE